jgi:hypothetical protein
MAVMTTKAKLGLTRMEAMAAENQRLRFDVQKLKDQVRKERRRADQHADEIACLRQQQVEMVRRRLNGVAP